MNPADFTTDEECSANRGLHWIRLRPISVYLYIVDYILYFPLIPKVHKIAVVDGNPHF